ncbi:hypothetical protein C7974DRAFT_410712 [Boeremia exigua]|uniref:uncharacterized protein n=1 Tax=Boeremia exigua TaxID=749465 RepID=UPI001E8E83E1|nr:uncharacterized protein C7974DRAFT_410712 [Boeremia exigua]KAH6639759.1 hypothetical protein C7974DRAFT_410712 [Boeremia exigua]
MTSCCRTCYHRNHAVASAQSTPSLVSLSLVALTFKEDISPRTKSYSALTNLLNDIIDATDSSLHPTTFTLWSPCLSDPRVAVVVTTLSECSDVTCPIYNDIFAFLAHPPSIQQVYLDYSILSLATLSPERSIPCDIMALKAPNSGVAASIGKHFGWQPKRSSLSMQMQNTVPAFSRPGDLIRDFWAWAEVPYHGRKSRSSSLGSSSTHLPSPLMSTNSDEKNMSLYFAEDEDEADDIDEADEEALVMIFQWHDHAAAERFKHPLQKSYGPNGEEVRSDLWDEQVARPLRHFQSHGAKLDTYKVELKAVEPRMRAGLQTTGRERSGSKRLSMMALELGEKVSGIWR